MNENNWAQIVDESAYKIKTIADGINMNSTQFRKYINGDVKPRTKNREKMEQIMIMLEQHKKMVRHPSYGYATEEQIKQLNELGIGPTRDALMAQINKQNKNKGKIR